MEIEWLILADSAQVVANKLYVLGGGWDTLTVNKKLPVDHRCSVALSVKVPWNETNKKYSFEIELSHEDSHTEEPRSLARIQGQFEVGRPAGIPAGQEQRIQMAMDMGVKFEAAGTFAVVARIDGNELKRLYFNVIIPN